MKKKYLFFVLAVLVMALAAGFVMNRGGDVRDVERQATANTLYTDADVEAAMDLVVKTFSQGFEGCKLLTVAYDEEETQKEIERQRQRHGDLRLMVLVSSFRAGEDAEGGFERNMTYTGWKWILQDGDDGWKMISWGYA